MHLAWLTPFSPSAGVHGPSWVPAHVCVLRNSENMTPKYPDIVARLPGSLAPGVDSCVLDGEAVAWDPEHKKILPFQVSLSKLGPLMSKAVCAGWQGGGFQKGFRAQKTPLWRCCTLNASAQRLCCAFLEVATAVLTGEWSCSALWGKRGKTLLCTQCTQCVQDAHPGQNPRGCIKASVCGFGVVAVAFY
eukprot:scaffold8789_cov16-Tisochrysis_lutea.AAC.2